MMRRIMLVGANHSGKTALADYFDQQSLRRMACLFYGPQTLTVPGAYLESPWMLSHIIAAQQDARCVLMLAAAEQTRRHYPPGFAHAFRVPVIGVVTRRSDADCAPALADLAAAGIAAPYAQVCLSRRDELEALARRID